MSGKFGNWPLLSGRRYLVRLSNGKSSAAESLANDISFGVAASAANATIQGTTDDVAGQITGAPVSPGVSASIQGFSADVAGQFTATVSTTATIQGFTDGVSGQVTASTATNASIQGNTGDVTGAMAALPATNATVQGNTDDVSGQFTAGLSPANATLQGFSDDVSGSFTASVSSAFAIQGATDGVSGQFTSSPALSFIMQGSADDAVGQFDASPVNVTVSASIQGSTDDVAGQIIAAPLGFVATIGENTGQTPGVQDTLLRLDPGNASAQDTNFSAGLQLGASNFALGDAATTVIRFDLSSIPADAVITNASITFTLGNNSGTPTLGLQRAIPNWNINQATWNESNTGTDWGASGARLDGIDRVASSSSTVVLTSGQAGTITFFGLAADVQAMLVSNNNGWQLDRVDGGFNDGQFCVLKSSEETDGLRPYLSVIYTIPVLPPVTVGFSGGFIPDKPKRLKRKEIREYVGAAIGSFDTEDVPPAQIASLEAEIIKAIDERNYIEELYMAIHARDMVQQRIGQLLQDIEDEEDELLLLS